MERMTEPREIVAYLQKGEWFKADEVQRKRAIDKGAFVDANPYTIVALINGHESGRDVPEWINLDEQGELYGEVSS